MNKTDYRYVLTSLSSSFSKIFLEFLSKTTCTELASQSSSVQLTQEVDLSLQYPRGIWGIWGKAAETIETYTSASPSSWTSPRSHH